MFRYEKGRADHTGKPQAQAVSRSRFKLERNVVVMSKWSVVLEVNKVKKTIAG